MKPLAPVLVLVLVLTACGGGGSGAVSRQDVRSCLDAAGLGPEDTGLFIFGSPLTGDTAVTDVEALGVRMASAGRVLLFVFDEDGASWVEYVTDNAASEAAEVGSIGNVVIAYENVPTEDERDQVEGCVT